MKYIKQLQSFKLSKDDYEFTGELKDARNIWGLMIPTYTSKNEDDSRFTVNISPNIIGAVIQYRDGRFECELDNNDFQSDYTEDELKQIIVDDIISSIVGERAAMKLVRQVDYIKEHDNDFTDLNKDEQ